MTDEEFKIIAFVAIGLFVLFLLLVGETILRRRKQRVLESEMETVRRDSIERYDGFAPGEAIILAWSESDGFPRWHRQMQDEVRKNMPVLARALDRMVEN